MHCGAHEGYCTCASLRVSASISVVSVRYKMPSTTCAVNGCQHCHNSTTVISYHLACRRRSSVHKQGQREVWTTQALCARLTVFCYAKPTRPKFSAPALSFAWIKKKESLAHAARKSMVFEINLCYLEGAVAGT